MRYNKIGNSELLVSEIGLGCMSLPDDYLSAGIRIIQSAFDFGINYFDTADLYGRGANESLVGKALEGIRQKIVLATKVGNQWKGNKEGWDWNPSRIHILRSVEDSLRRLNTDYIDLYQLHGGTREDNFEEIVETFELLVQQGKIRHYGISSIRPNVFTAYLQRSGIVSDMMQYSLLDTRPEEFFDEFQKYGASVIARGAMAQGILLDKPVGKAYLDHQVEDVQVVKNLVSSLSDRYGVSKQAIALKYCLDNAVVCSALVGIRTLEQLAQLQQSYTDYLEIVDKDMGANFSALRKIRYREHR